MKNTLNLARTLLVSLALFAVAATAPGASAAETKVKKHSFEYNSIGYFRDKAENVQIASYGEKKDPIGAEAYLAVQNKVMNKYLDGRVRFVTKVAIDWSKQTQADVEANALSYFNIGSKVAIGGSYEKFKSAQLVLVKLAIDEGPLKTMLNTDADGARNYLADEGGDGRIVSEVWIVMDGKLAEHFATSGSISVSSATGNAEVTATGGVAGSQTIVISPGSTFAYMLHKVKDWSNNKTVVADLEDDTKGLN